MKRILYYITDFFFHLIRGFQFMKMGWKDQDWDYDYLLDLEYMKLMKMQDYFSKSDISVNDKQKAFEINIALKLLDIIRENDKADELIDINAPLGEAKFEQTKHVNTKNASRFFKSQTFLDRVNENSSFGVIIRNDLRIEKAWYLYNEIRKEWMRSWWN